MMAEQNGGLPTPRVSKLGHVGLYVKDIEMMRDWYRDNLGLTVTDGDVQAGIVFLSAQPDVEHHELALARGREQEPGVQLVQQVSWIVDSVEMVQAFHYRLKERGVEIQQEVTHGNSMGIYFYDPEGNRNEVYYRTGLVVAQPFRRNINFEQSAEGVLDENQRLINDGMPALPR
jgi:catechol-2,3-dioxygenase